MTSFNRPFSGYYFEKDQGYSIQFFERGTRKPLPNLDIYLRIEGELVENKTDSNGIVIHQIPAHVDSIDVLAKNSDRRNEAWMNLPSGDYLLALSSTTGAGWEPPKRRGLPRERKLPSYFQSR